MSIVLTTFLARPPPIRSVAMMLCLLKIGVAVIVVVCGFSIFLFFVTDCLSPIYQLFKGRVFCRHCKKHLYLASFADHPCVVIPKCPECGAYLGSRSTTCKNCSCDLRDYLKITFPDCQIHSVSRPIKQPLTDEEASNMYPGLRKRFFKQHDVE